MMALNMTTNMMWAAVISQGLFFPSLLYTSPTRRKHLYKVMGQLRVRSPTPPYTTPSQYKNYEDKYHQGNGGSYSCCSVKKR